MASGPNWAKLWMHKVGAATRVGDLCHIDERGEFSIYRKTVRGVSPGVADALHFHQLIYRRIVRSVFHDDESRRVLMRNNRTSPYLWGFTLLTVVPAVLFWNNTPLLMAFCGLFVISYVMAYMAIVRFKVPEWLRR